MTASSDTDIKELKEFISDRFNELKLEITNAKSELKQEITEVKSELKQEITEAKGEIKVLGVEIKGINKRLSTVETAVQKIPEITEKFGELKNWRQTAFVIIAAVVSAFLGWIARAGKI